MYTKCLNSPTRIRVNRKIESDEEIGLAGIPSADTLPSPREIEGLRRIRFWQRLYQIYLLSFFILWPLTILIYGTRWRFGISIGNGRAIAPILLSSVLWIAGAGLLWARLGALKCPRCGFDFYRIEPQAEYPTGYRRHFQPFHPACDYCGLSTEMLRIMRG